MVLPTPWPLSSMTRSSVLFSSPTLSLVTVPVPYHQTTIPLFLYNFVTNIPFEFQFAPSGTVLAIFILPHWDLQYVDSTNFSPHNCRTSHHKHRVTFLHMGLRAHGTLLP